MRAPTNQPRPATPHLRRIASCITQIKAQGPSRTCDESKEEEGGEAHQGWPAATAESVNLEVVVGALVKGTLTVTTRPTVYSTTVRVSPAIEIEYLGLRV